MNNDLRILIIDDQRPNLDLMEQLLVREGLSNVLSSTEPLRTLDLFNSFEPDLVTPACGPWRWGPRISSANRWMPWKPCCGCGTCWRRVRCITPCAR